MKADHTIQQAVCTRCQSRLVRAGHIALTGRCMCPEASLPAWQDLPPGPEHTAFQIALDLRIRNRAYSGYWRLREKVYADLTDALHTRQGAAVLLSNEQLAAHMERGGRIEVPNGSV